MAKIDWLTPRPVGVYFPWQIPPARPFGCLKDLMLIALATDGDDGPTDEAGAVVTGDSSQMAESFGFRAADHMSRNDAYPFFDALAGYSRS